MIKLCNKCGFDTTNKKYRFCPCCGIKLHIDTESFVVTKKDIGYIIETECYSQETCSERCPFFKDFCECDWIINGGLVSDELLQYVRQLIKDGYEIKEG